VLYHDPPRILWSKYQEEMFQLSIRSARAAVDEDAAAKRRGEGGNTVALKVTHDTNELVLAFGLELIDDVLDTEIPDGMTAKEALVEFATGALMDFGRTMLLGNGGLRLDLGKSVSPSEPT
jgi:hypothetical protein